MSLVCVCICVRAHMYVYVCVRVHARLLTIHYTLYVASTLGLV